jgi:hypothetical protein
MAPDSSCTVVIGRQLATAFAKCKVLRGCDPDMYLHGCVAIFSSTIPAVQRAVSPGKCRYEPSFPSLVLHADPA